MFDFFLAYPLAILVGLISAAFAPGERVPGYLTRVRFAAATAFGLTMLLALVFFSFSGAPVLETVDIALMAGFWGGLFGGIGGLVGTAFRHLIIRE
jgi:hypothetical protein